MKKDSSPLTIAKIKRTHRERRDEIKGRLSEFSDVWAKGSDGRIWEEMVFCFFTGGCSAKMGLRSIEAIRHLLEDGTQPEIAKALSQGSIDIQTPELATSTLPEPF